MSTRRRIKLSFEHPTLCGDVTVDIYVPLPEPIVESCKRMAARVCPACPICKQPMQYAGFLFENADDREELNRPFPGTQPQESVGVEALRQYAKQREYIQAIRWTGEVTPAVAALLGSRVVVIATTTRSLSLGNGWYADIGDWIASEDGEKIVVIGDDVFRRVYEEVRQDQPNETRMAYPRVYGTAAATLSFRVCAACTAAPGSRRSATLALTTESWSSGSDTPSTSCFTSLTVSVPKAGRHPRHLDRSRTALSS